MKVVIQRVSQSSVTIEGQLKSQIEKGLLVLLGIAVEDDPSDVDWLCQKIVSLRIFNDDKGVMNLSVKDIDGEILLISQFTLQAKTKKGNRPSYINAAPPEIAIPLYHSFTTQLEKNLGKPIKTGVFGADMKVSLTNEGPVTICIDSRNRK